MAGEYTGGGVAGGLNVGTLTINLALDMSKVAKQTEEMNSRMKSMASMAESVFKATGGHVGQLGERIGQLNNSLKKVFGDGAPAMLQQFGREVQRVAGLTDAQVKALGQSAGALEGAFKAAGAAITTLLSPLGAVLAAALGVAAAIGAVKNAADAMRSAGGGGGPGLWSRMNTWAEENVPGARWTNEALSTAGSFYRKQWNDSAATPGTLAETISKIDVAADLKAAFGRIAKDLEAALGPVSRLLQPGTSAADRGKAATDAAGHQLKFAESINKSMQAADQAQFEAMEKMQEKLGEESMRHARDLADQKAMIWQQELDALEEVKAQNALGYASLNKAGEDVWRGRLAAEQEMADRWSALGSGQIGTAAGMSGIGGNMLNIAGSAASGYRYTGTALQGAASGASNGGGGWGALIGAIIALATQTESFSKIMNGIEGVLGKVVFLLDSALKPITKSLDGILDFVGEIVGVVAGVLDGISELVDTQGLGQSIGSKDDQWGQYSVNDWLMLTPVFTELGNEISKLMGNSDRVAYEGPSAAAQSLMASQEQARRDAWDMDPRNPYYALNMQAKALAEIDAAQVEAKQNETREAERAAAALKEVADASYNAVQGYKILGAMYAAQQSINRDPLTGNPFS